MAIDNKMKNEEPEIISSNDARGRSVSHTGWEDYSGWGNMNPILDDLAKRGISTNYGPAPNSLESKQDHIETFLKQRANIDYNFDNNEESEIIPSNDARGRNEVY